jgi:hypothetical protein
MTETAIVPKCTSWRGHKFEARYSYGAPRKMTEVELFWLPYTTRKDVLTNARSQTYIHDVCIRCGTIVEKNTAISDNKKPE